MTATTNNNTTMITNEISTKLIEMGKAAYAKNIKAPCNDAAVLDYLSASKIDWIKGLDLWIKGWTQAHLASN